MTSLTSGVNASDGGAASPSVFSLSEGGDALKLDPHTRLIPKLLLVFSGGTATPLTTACLVC